MGDHDAPASWLQRWHDTEPLRLYLYGITVPLLGAAVVYGWLTTEQLGAWLAVAAALFTGSTVAGELARRVVWAPATVDRQLATTDSRAYSDGLADGERRAAVAPLLVAEERPQLATTAMARLDRCRHVESGNRCVLPAHPGTVVHRYE